MLDQIDLDRSMPKQEYHRQLPTLQAQLYTMEQAVVEAGIPVLVVFEGWAGTSKIGTIGALTRRLDPRGLRVHPITAPRTYETLYPWLYRFWLKIPRYGQIALFDRSWYRELLTERTRAQLSGDLWRSRCEDIAAFERQLADDGAVILKFWLHISRREQGRRFRKALADRLTAWQITEDDRWQQRHYKRVNAAVEDLMARTDAPYAPWVVVPATSKRFAQVAVIETILRTFQRRVGNVAGLRFEQNEDTFDEGGAVFRQRVSGTNGLPTLHAAPPTPPATLPADDGFAPPLATPNILQAIDLSQKIDDQTYARKLARLQSKLHLLGLKIYQQQRPVVLVFEGWDAAGKGGAIQRVTEQIDPRGYVVHAIAAPSGDDKVHHYLYRFWRRLPTRGSMAIFDRSWYGRVLVERVEGFARADEWQRAYAEINEFERQLVDFGAIVCKFWMHISPEEQLRRFESRQTVAYKAWKLTDEDWRNRDKWPQYEQAANEMLLRTSTPAAPWTIVEAEDKHFARIKVLRTLVRRLEEELGKVKL